MGFNYSNFENERKKIFNGWFIIGFLTLFFLFSARCCQKNIKRSQMTIIDPRSTRMTHNVKKIFILLWKTKKKHSFRDHKEAIQGIARNSHSQKIFGVLILQLNWFSYSDSNRSAFFHFFLVETINWEDGNLFFEIFLLWSRLNVSWILEKLLEIDFFREFLIIRFFVNLERKRWNFNEKEKLLFKFVEGSNLISL